MLNPGFEIGNKPIIENRHNGGEADRAGSVNRSKNLVGASQRSNGAPTLIA
jgi:hypothetical protein